MKCAERLGPPSRETHLLGRPWTDHGSQLEHQLVGQQYSPVARDQFCNFACALDQVDATQEDATQLYVS